VLNEPLISARERSTFSKAVAFSACLHVLLGWLVVFGLPKLFLHWVEEDPPFFVPIQVLYYSSKEKPEVHEGAGAVEEKAQLRTSDAQVAQTALEGDSPKGTEKPVGSIQSKEEKRPPPTAPHRDEIRAEAPRIDGTGKVLAEATTDPSRQPADGSASHKPATASRSRQNGEQAPRQGLDPEAKPAAEKSKAEPGRAHDRLRPDDASPKQPNLTETPAPAKPREPSASSTAAATERGPREASKTAGPLAKLRQAIESLFGTGATGRSDKVADTTIVYPVQEPSTIPPSSAQNQSPSAARNRVSTDDGRAQAPTAQVPTAQVPTAQAPTTSAPAAAVGSTAATEAPKLLLGPLGLHPLPSPSGAASGEAAGVPSLITPADAQTASGRPADSTRTAPPAKSASKSEQAKATAASAESAAAPPKQQAPVPRTAPPTPAPQFDAPRKAEQIARVEAPAIPKTQAQATPKAPARATPTTDVPAKDAPAKAQATAVEPPTHSARIGADATTAQSTTRSGTRQPDPARQADATEPAPATAPAPAARPVASATSPKVPTQEAATAAAPPSGPDAKAFAPASQAAASAASTPPSTAGAPSRSPSATVKPSTLRLPQRLLPPPSPADPVGAALDAVQKLDHRVPEALLRPPSPDNPENASRVEAMRKLMAQAAKEGYTNAQYALGRMLLQGRGSAPDPSAATQWLKRAAEKGHIEAQILYGYLAAAGEGMPRNLGEAFLWWSIAAEQGNAAGAAGRDKLTPLVDPIQLARLRGLTRHWMALRDELKEPASSPKDLEEQATRLSRAAAEGDEQQVRAILARGADPNGIDESGRTALINASWRGRIPTVQVLLSVGADYDFVGKDGQSALSWASANGYADVAKLLLETGAKANLTDLKGRTPLMRAAWNNHPEVVAELLAAGADPSLTDQDDKNALDYARISGNARAIQLLTRKAGPGD
jgi:hypothetical protein